MLTHAELKHGDVSLAYVSRLMHRHYPDTPLFKKVLQSIWHQVNNGQEIYVVGKILADETVKGGTGWGAEFAKLCNKPLFVFDQERDGWFQLDRRELGAGQDPVIRHPHFTGTGTRFLARTARARHRRALRAHVPLSASARPHKKVCRIVAPTAATTSFGVRDSCPATNPDWSSSRSPDPAPRRA